MVLPASSAFRQIAIDVVEHKTTHLLVAYSKDLPGLTVAARSRDQLEREIPGAIRELLEAEGNIVITVQTERFDDFSANFDRSSLLARAELQAA